ncbi:LytTR family DNA-binding domain-containing protein [Luteimonas sp. M1R5S18]|uniref:LytTR family DNA-binding domain-containing protein n=1 Tax=Luteimonas rhizosphaericola TaxID=3042024 RepID=A0ABT6JGP8_9GAMM|nr:LytTR family DNA-binding domain-containing protein [Luteimonas rhizosphaericola]MDH5829853.1 LytTR family DNA-binding domain-containing protein [Luteimonas rhizosphaericola]
MSAAPTAYERYLPWRHWAEAGFVAALLLSNVVGNSLTTWIELNRGGPSPVALWEPVVWEASSAAMWALLIPAIAWLTRRWPTHWDNWRQRLPLHLLASAVVCLLHVAGMIGLRVLAYRWQGLDYGFGPWPRELLYEYLKDVRSYASIVVIVEVYRLLLRRLQGEASFLAAPDDAPPADPGERPDRFLVRKLGREFLVAANDIEWLQAAGNYVNLRVRGHDYPLRSTISGIEERLDPGRFLRIHRSYIVNLDRLASIEPLDTGDARVHLHDGTVLPASRRYRGELRERLGEA